MEGYEYRYENDRDRKWEEDVLFFAEKFLTGHLLLADDNFYTRIRTIEGTAPVEDYRYDNSHYNSNLRAEFIVQINSLIDSIPGLSDVEIVLQMQKIAAMLQDSHSEFFLSNLGTKRLPIHFECFTTSDGFALYATTVPAEHRELLYAKLISINGVSVGTIIQYLSQYISSETTTHLASYIARDDSLLYLELLQAAGVLETNSFGAELVFEADGMRYTHSLPFVTDEEYMAATLIDGSLESQNILQKRQDQNYWFEILENQTLYIRFFSMYQEETYSPYDMARDISMVLRDADVPLKIIIDFRDNGGGTSWDLHNLVDAINRYDTDGVYILINEHSASAAVIVPYIFSVTIDDAVMVGTPAAQPVCFFSTYNSLNNYRLPNSGWVFRVSDMYNDMNPQPEHMDQPLIPNILVYPDIEDYQRGIDTVLEYVLSL